MSEMINNREYRRKVLKDLITDLHNGKSVDEVKQRFEDTFSGVSAAEISEVEQALIMDGMPVAEVQRLCDVHAAVFKGSIEDIHRPKEASEVPGHPVHTLKNENRALERLIEKNIKPHLEKLSNDRAEAVKLLRKDLELLSAVDIHYKRKENILFPYLEKYGITAPPKVMWGVDDEIRALIKKAETALDDTPAVAAAAIREATDKINEMIFKEENILIPMMLEQLTEDEWEKIYNDSDEIGYCLIDKPVAWKPQGKEAAARKKENAGQEGALVFPSGVLTLSETRCILNTLPFDITFVDKDDTVKYFSEGRDRIFARTKAVIGRKVTNCHPPASVHIVEKIIKDFKDGKKDHEDFWIKMGKRYVFIRYFAVRSEEGEFLGTLEVTQDIAPIVSIGGEKRLVEP
ncbi:MAG: Hemerythrin HHE cation binding domain protein [Firmicutes bacterium ADurb.Bin182]|nr:MAG: Hemerythrin HHE cation binding domain protein [Firmicutes bacterium ADurb.Bin182]